MQGLWLSKGSWAFKPDLLDPVIGLDESLVAVEAAGICGTDLELARGYYDFNGIPGHEFIGRVVSGARAGQRVVADINLGCGRCQRCQAGVHRHCAERVVIGIHQRAGAFAQFLSVPNNNLITVDEDLSDGLAVLAEPVAAALEIIEQMPKPLPSRVLVVGAGRLGFWLRKCWQALIARLQSWCAVRSEQPTFKISAFRLSPALNQNRLVGLWTVLGRPRVWQPLCGLPCRKQYWS